MAEIITFVGCSGSIISATGAVITTNYVSGTGNCLFAFYQAANGAVPPASNVTDSAGNVWVLVASANVIQITALYATQNVIPSPITSVTVTGTGTAALYELIVIEYKNVGSYRSAAPVATTTSTVASISGNISDPYNVMLAVGTHRITNSGVFTPQNGNIRIQLASSTTRRNVVIDNTSPVSGAIVTCSATLVSQPWQLVLAELISKGIKYIGSASNAVTASTSVTTNYTSSGGALFAIFTGVGALAIPAATQFSDNAGNNWTFVATVSTNPSVSIYATQSLTPLPVNSVTVSGLASGFYELSVIEYVEVFDWRLLLVPTATTTSTLASVSGNLSAPGNYFLAAGGHVTNNSGVFTAVAGTIRIQYASNTTRRSVVMDNTASVSGTLTCAASMASIVWSMVMIELMWVGNNTVNVNIIDTGSGASLTSYVSDSITPTNGDLFLIMVLVVSIAPAAFNKIGNPKISGCGLNFNYAATVGNTGLTRRLWLFYANADSSDVPGALTFAFDTAPQNNCIWEIHRVKGHDNSTPISWCVQIAGVATSISSAHNPTATLDALQDSQSLVLGTAFTALSAAQASPGAGWIQLTEFSAPTLMSEFKFNDNVLTWGNTGTTTNDLIIGVELTSNNTGKHNNPLASHLLSCAGAGA